MAISELLVCLVGVLLAKSAQASKAAHSKAARRPAKTASASVPGLSLYERSSERKHPHEVDDLTSTRAPSSSRLSDIDGIEDSEGMPARGERSTSPSLILRRERPGFTVAGCTAFGRCALCHRAIAEHEALYMCCDVTYCSSVCRSRGLALSGDVPEGFLWRFVAPQYERFDIRVEPYVDAPIAPGCSPLRVGEVFSVDVTRRGEHGVTFLRLSDGRGWVFDSNTEIGVLCTPHREEAELLLSDNPGPSRRPLRRSCSSRSMLNDS